MDGGPLCCQSGEAAVATTLATFLEEMGRTLEEQSKVIYEMSKKLREDLGLPAVPRKAGKRHRAIADPNAPK